jgi:hypothetical protein
MTKKTATAIQTAFAKANGVGDLPAAVQAARAAVKAELLTGNLDDDPSTLIELLRGDARHDRPAGLSGEAWAYHCTDLYAALAMGIALGQLLHPDVFATGGAR